jgi:hypothetical protein
MLVSSSDHIHRPWLTIRPVGRPGMIWLTTPSPAGGPAPGTYLIL